jgi:predicted dehydrogenase
MINTALIGFGLSGRTIQAPFFQTNPRFNLISIVTTRDIPSHLFPKAKAVKNIDDILKDNNIELVSICSPSYTHFDYAMLCLEAGKHVLIDKPVADNLDQAKEIFNLANKKKLVAAVFQNRRFDSDFMTIQHLIASGSLGKIISYEARYDRYKPELHTKKWKEEVIPGNGIIYDLGPHIIDQAIHLFGKPETIKGETLVERTGSLIKDAFKIKLVTNGIDIHLSSSLMVKDPSPRYTITGTNGIFIKYGIDMQEDHLNADIWPGMDNFGVDINHGILTTYDDHKEVKINTIPGNWMVLIDSLADTIEHGKEFCIKQEDILTQMKIINTVNGFN